MRKKYLVASKDPKSSIHERDLSILEQILFDRNIQYLFLCRFFGFYDIGKNSVEVSLVSLIYCRNRMTLDM